MTQPTFETREALAQDQYRRQQWFNNSEWYRDANNNVMCIPAHAHLLDRPSGLSDDAPQLGE